MQSKEYSGDDFSFVKRKVEEVLQVMKFHNQVKGVKLKLIVDNVNNNIV